VTLWLHRAQWHDAVGLVGMTNTDYGLLGTIWRIDGAGYSRNTAGIDGGLTHNIKTGGLAQYASLSFFEGFDLRILRAVGTERTGAIAGKAWTVLRDRYLRVHNASIYSWIPGDLTETLEATIDDDTLITGVVPTVSPSRLPGKVFIGYPVGRIFEYDTVALTVSPIVRYVAPCFLGPFYSPKLGVFLGIDGDEYAQAISIYVDEVVATQVSAPAAVTPAKVAQTFLAETYVMGSEDEPCIGKRVNWEATGAGVMIQTQSKTDDNGAARARVRVDVECLPAAEINVSATVVV